jgi:hypothetical protein
MAQFPVTGITRGAGAPSSVVARLLESRSLGADMEAQAIRTQRGDDVRQCIEAAIARRKDVFALSYVVWTADYGYIVKFRLGDFDAMRTAVEMLVFEEPWRMDRMLDGVRLTFKALVPSV